MRIREGLSCFFTGRQSQNLAFSGPGKQTLCMTAREGLYRVRMLSKRSRPPRQASSTSEVFWHGRAGRARVAAPRPAPIAKAGFSTRDRLHGWHGRTRTGESIGIKIRAFRREISVDLAEMAQQRRFALELRALPTCSWGKDFRAAARRPTCLAPNCLNRPATPFPWR
jgi:hypothetical protein